MANKEQFDMISKKITRDSRLTDSGYRLIMLMINNSNGWEINTTYFGNLLGWSPKKLSNATKNLIQLGYLEKIKFRSGNGFKYQYKINTDGNKPMENESLIIMSGLTETNIMDIDTKEEEIIPQNEDMVINEYTIKLNNGITFITPKDKYEYLQHVKINKPKKYTQLMQSSSETIFNFTLNDILENDYIYQIKKEEWEENNIYF